MGDFGLSADTLGTLSVVLPVLTTPFLENLAKFVPLLVEIPRVLHASDHNSPNGPIDEQPGKWEPDGKVEDDFNDVLTRDTEVGFIALVVYGPAMDGILIS